MAAAKLEVQALPREGESDFADAARLFFLGRMPGLNLSMVQKALLLHKPFYEHAFAERVRLGRRSVVRR